MLFNSLHFLLFFPVVVALYFGLPHRLRWGALLAASYYFYMAWEPAYVLLIVASTLVDYGVALRMSRLGPGPPRRPYLIVSLISNLGLLFLFKYFDFFNASAAGLATALGMEYAVPALELLLPVGISFYTFQTLGYTIDVYRGAIEPERHLGIFALYVSFFPQLVAGPIERSRRLLPQFRRPVDFDYARTVSGLQLMLWGFLKKLLIADRLAIYVDRVYAHPQAYTGLPLVVATYFFAFQIFCDFSAYSDIARGAARILGFDLMENFRRPYLARSISEFWKRWHISLSSWFRDYLYIPLGGNRVGRARWYANLLVVFLVSGLWHGANWTFVVWGALHGGYLVASEWSRPSRELWVERIGLARRPRLRAGVQRLVTFHLALVAWVFFRASSLSDALHVVTHAFVDLRLDLAAWARAAMVVPNAAAYAVPIFLVHLGAIAAMEWVHVRQERHPERDPFDFLGTSTRWPVYASLVAVLMLLGEFGGNQFIYFQF